MDLHFKYLPPGLRDPLGEPRASGSLSASLTTSGHNSIFILIFVNKSCCFYLEASLANRMANFHVRLRKLLTSLASFQLAGNFG